METTKILIGYSIYLPIAIFLTYYVSKTLFKNGKIYMLDIFKGREEIANVPINKDEFKLNLSKTKNQSRHVTDKVHKEYKNNKK